MDWTSSKETNWICRQIVTEALDGIIIADREGTIRLWNTGAERIFGRPAAEALGQTLDLIVPEKYRVDHWAGFQKTMASGVTKYGAETLNVPAMRADGSRASIEFTVVLLREPAGRVAGVAAIIRDATARREKELALKKRLEALEADSSGTAR